MRLALCALAAFALTSCTQHADDAPEGAVPPADAPVAPAPPAAPTAPAASGSWPSEINAVGTEPFWGLEITKERMILSGPDRQDLVVSHSSPTINGPSAVFEGAAGEVGLKATLTPQPCSDGMSDRTYPYAATVQTGAETLTGCAAPKDPAAVTP
jgi:uncharacterized membrane protein